MEIRSVDATTGNRVVPVLDDRDAGADAGAEAEESIAA